MNTYNYEVTITISGYGIEANDIEEAKTKIKQQMLEENNIEGLQNEEINFIEEVKGE